MATLLDTISSLTSTPAIIIPHQTNPVILSHEELSKHVLSFGEKLLAAGITRSNAVAIVFPNSLEFAVSFLAVAVQRAVCAPLNPAYKEEEFIFYLEDLSPGLVLVPRGTIVGNGDIVTAAKKCNTKIAEVYWNGDEVVLEWGRQRVCEWSRERPHECEESSKTRTRRCCFDTAHEWDHRKTKSCMNSRLNC
jgi:acyl-CoA synthetase (AMP-forming)/AMP-acid ligase II